MAGKTNAKHIRVYVDDTSGTPVDLSAYVDDIEIPKTHDDEDVTGYGDGVRNVQVGHPSIPLTISGNFSNDTDASWPVLTGIVGKIDQTYTVTIEIGIKAEPAGGDPQFTGEYYCNSLVWDGSLKFTAAFEPASTTAPAWGTK